MRRRAGWGIEETRRAPTQTNLTYAVRYLANAYRRADGNEDRAAALFRGGYYHGPKHKNMQDLLRPASSPTPTPEPAPPLLGSA